MSRTAQRAAKLLYQIPVKQLDNLECPPATCLVTYGVPDEDDAFESELAAEQPDGTLPLWVAQIKRCRSEDKDWVEGGIKHRDMILDQLHRYAKKGVVSSDKAESANAKCVVTNTGTGTSPHIPSAVRNMLPEWCALFASTPFKGKQRNDAHSVVKAIEERLVCILAMRPGKDVPGADDKM